jgi:hypothetical protein
MSGQVSGGGRQGGNLPFPPPIFIPRLTTNPDQTHSTHHRAYHTHYPAPPHRHFRLGFSMKYLILCAVLILHGLHRIYVALQPSHAVTCIGVVVLVSIACYAFYPAYTNVEGGLDCTVTTLAGDSKIQQGKFPQISIAPFSFLPIILSHSRTMIFMHRPYSFTGCTCIQ